MFCSSCVGGRAGCGSGRSWRTVCGLINSPVGNSALRLLSLRDCTQLRGEIVDSLPAFHRLTRLDLARCGFVRDEHLQTLGKLHELRVLSLDGNPLVTDAGLAHLRDLDKLEELDLRANPNVTVEGLRRLEGLKLRRLTIAACRAIDLEDSRRLETEWKDCVFVR